MGLNNENVREHMNALFGEMRANDLRTKLSLMSSHERELTIVEELGQAFKTMGYPFILPFRFRNDEGTRTSHHLIYVSKEFLGYNIMKGIMANVSSSTAQGVASFEYNPADKRMPMLFELNRPIDDLANILLSEFAGKTLTIDDFYENHSVNRPYTERNYKDVLLQLETEKKITTSPSVLERRKGTFSNSVKITFPQKLE